MKTKRPKRRVERKRYVLDRSTPRPVVNATMLTASIGTPNTHGVFTFNTPVIIPGDTPPDIKLRTTVSPVAVVAVGPLGITLDYGSTLTASNACTFSGFDPNLRAAQGGYVLPKTTTF